MSWDSRDIGIFQEAFDKPWIADLIRETDITDIVHMLRAIDDIVIVRDFKRKIRHTAKEHCPEAIGLCRCHFCKKDFEGVYRKSPKSFGIYPETVCNSCRKYQAYLKMFPTEKRHELLRNRRCEKCRINKVQNKIMARRVCPPCYEHSKKKGKGKSRAFFQAMAMQEAVSDNS